MPHPSSKPDATPLARIRSALAERDREISAGRWLAFGTLVLYGAGFAAVAGILGAFLDQRFALGDAGHRLAVVTSIVVSCALVVALGLRSPPVDRRTPGAWAGHPGRLFVQALRLAARRRQRPSAATLREAAALLDAAGDPAQLAKRIAAGGSPAMRALELLRTLDLVSTRSLRRSNRARLPPGSQHSVPDLGSGDGSHRSPARSLARTGEVRGLRERWQWSGGAGALDLHAAALAGWVVVRDETRLTSLAADRSQRWSRPVGGGVTGLHVACDGARVAVLAEGGVVTLLSGESGERLGQLAGGDAATAVAVAAGGARVWIGDRFGVLRIFDGRSRLIREVRVGHPIDFVAVASEVESGLVASRRGHLSSVDPALGETHRTFIRSDVHRAWIEEDGQRALLAVPADGVLAWDFGTGSMDTYALDRPVRDAASDAPGDRLVALTFDDRLVLLDSGARVLWQCDAPTGAQRVRMSGDGDRVWCVDSAGNVRQLDVLDRVDAERPVLDLGAGAVPAIGVDQAVVEMVAEPEPGGFRRLLIGPHGRGAVLIHPDGRAAIQHDLRNGWLVTAPGGTGTGDAVVTDDGSALGLVLDRGVRRIRLSDGTIRDVALPSPRLARVARQGDMVASTPNGELWLVSDGRDERIATGLDGLSDLVTCSYETGSWTVWWSRVDGTVTRLDPRTARSTAVVSPADVTAPVRLVATGDRVVIVDAAGHVRWLTADGREITRASVSVPIVHAQSAGGQAAALTDFLGNVHLVVADAGLVGTLARPEGILRAGADPRGEPWLLRVHRQLLLGQSWDGSIRTRARVTGTPLDLASGPAGSWGVLTTAGLFAGGPAQVPSSDRARFLEL